MGTRHLVCVYYKGRFYVAQYGQWDGYPDGQGLVIYRFLQEPGNLVRLKKGLEHIRVLKTGEDFAPYLHTSPADNPTLSRDTGAKILYLVASATEEKPVPLRLDLEFVNDSLFCEWCYVLDLDAEKLEVYAGEFRLDINDEEARTLFAEVGGSKLGLLKAFEFAGLPETEEEFVEQVKRESRG